MRQHPLGSSTAGTLTGRGEATAPSGVKVLRALGADGRTESLLAQVPNFAVPLVLRVVKAGQPVPADFVERTRQLAAVAHPALLGIRGAGALADGRVYVAHDFVEGDTLATRALPIEMLVAVGVQVARALETVHAAGFTLGAISTRDVLLATPPRLDGSLAALSQSTPQADVTALATVLITAGAAGADAGPFESSVRRALSAATSASGLVAALEELQGHWRARTQVSGEYPAVPPAEGEEEPDLTGQVLGQYGLEKVIGEGAMGRVYLGRHLRIGRLAAVKVLKNEHARSGELVQRFIQEAQAVNAIKDEHIVEVYDFGEAPAAGQNRVYCVMELLEGQSLADLSDRGPIPVRRLAKICQQLASALHAAHQVGVVHRDIKPDNIYLHRRDGDPDFVKVLDFGVAKLLKPIGDLPLSGTQAGIVVGTPEYMAPEQALGMGTDRRTDVYAAGLVMYEMLTGGLPFKGDTFGKLVVEITSRPLAPLGLRSFGGEPIPPGLNDVVLKALDREVERRYQSAAELAAALEPFANPTAAALAAEAQAAARQEARDAAVLQRSPLPKVLAAVAVLAAAGVAAAFALGAFEPGAVDLSKAQADLAVKPAPAPAEPAPKPAPAPAPVEPAARVTLEVESTPPGAKVVRLDTNAVLGTTPLKVELEQAEGVPLELTLDGRSTVRKEVALSGNVSLSVELPLKPADGAKKKKKGPVSRDAVVDPFNQ